MALADAAAARAAGRYASIVDAIGHTPLVAIPRMSPNPDVRHLRQAGVPEPDRLGQGPRGAGAHRGPRGVRPAGARLHHPGADQRQHRHRAGHDRAPQGLSGRGRAARQRDPRAAPAAAPVRRRDHRFARAAGLQRGRCHGEGAGGARPALRDALPVRQPGQPRCPRGDDGRGDHRRLPRGGRVRGRPGHGRHAHGRRATAEALSARTSGSTPPSRCPARRSRACGRWTRGSSRRSSTRACWTASSWSATRSRSRRCGS